MSRGMSVALPTPTKHYQGNSSKCNMLGGPDYAWANGTYSDDKILPYYIYIYICIYTTGTQKV